MVVSTALFAIVSLVLWAAIINVFNDKLEDFLYLPVLFGSGYRSVAIFVDQQVTNIDLLFTPVMAVVGAFGGVAMVALAPSLREELAPSDHSLTPVWAARLGMWMNGARRCLGYMFGAIGPAVAMIFGAVYLAIFPGMGNFAGASGWTSIGTYESQMAQQRARFEAHVASLQGKSLQELAANPAAMSTRFLCQPRSIGRTSMSAMPVSIFLPSVNAGASIDAFANGSTAITP
jgi:hypothetical protein